MFKKLVLSIILILGILFPTACNPGKTSGPASNPPPPSPSCIIVRHSPLVPVVGEEVTFSVKSCDVGGDIQLLINSSPLSQPTPACGNTSCEWKLSFAANALITYQASITAAGGSPVTSPVYTFTVLEGNYQFNASNSYSLTLASGASTQVYATNVIPVRLANKQTANQIDFVFYRSSDYPDVGVFLDDVGRQVEFLLERLSISGEPANSDLYNFYVFSPTTHIVKIITDIDKPSCGNPITTTQGTSNNVNILMPWRNVDATLHQGDITDCSSFGHFSAEGGASFDSKSFRHEGGHTIFGLSDEYDHAVHYFQATSEPNMFSTRGICATEQASKGRGSGTVCETLTRVVTPTAIYFRSRPDPTPSNADLYIMEHSEGTIWGYDGNERVRWVFSHVGASHETTKDTVLWEISYENGTWKTVSVEILPCSPEVQLFEGPEGYPLVESSDENRKSIRSRRLSFDPRIVFVDSVAGEEPFSSILDQVVFTLRLPFTSGVDQLLVLNAAIDPHQPFGKENFGEVLRLTPEEINAAIERYQQSWPPEAAAPCQFPDNLIQELNK